MTITIRRATRDDWLAYRDIRLRALATAPEVYCATVEGELVIDDETWRSRCADSHLLLAMLGERIVGIAAGVPDAREANGREIVGMWVEPDARGVGAAAALVQALIDWARRDSAESIALRVMEGNGGARRVYERCGFVATGERDFVRGALWEIRMRLVLS